MKNIEMPTEENFILTNKKVKMIKAYMKEFIRSKAYELWKTNGEYVPDIEEYIYFMLSRLSFLKRTKLHMYVLTENADYKRWTSLVYYSHTDKSKPVIHVNVFGLVSITQYNYYKGKIFYHRTDDLKPDALPNGSEVHLQASWISDKGKFKGQMIFYAAEHHNWLPECDLYIKEKITIDEFLDHCKK